MNPCSYRLYGASHAGGLACDNDAGRSIGGVDKWWRLLARRSRAQSDAAGSFKQLWSASGRVCGGPPRTGSDTKTNPGSNEPSTAEKRA